jgi:formylglycine-generating enzyme required for sulfatase activity
MARIEKTVFISYRRKDISWALAVYQYLTSQKYDVFFDFSSIPSGDFEQIILSNIRARAHFILILTPTALDRCSDPGDWVRREIETAIKEKRNIVPLFFDDFRFGTPSVAEKLTGPLSDLPRYNGLNIPSGYFMEAMDRMCSRYLNVPLNAVLHPVSTEVQRIVKDHQTAANTAVLQRKAIEERLKSRKKTELADRLKASALSVRLSIGSISLLILVLGIIGINQLVRNTTTGAVRTTPTGNVVTPEPPTVTLTTTPAQVTPRPATITSSHSLAIGSTMVSSEDGMIMVYVPGGEFTMGSANGETEEKPVHRVSLDAFWIDQTEVTNAMYAKCVLADECDQPSSVSSYARESYFGNPDFGNYPVIYVSWADANAYCLWADRRLPTEAEWEKAARGTDRRIYPWGNEAPSRDLLNYNAMVGDTTEVDDYPNGASLYGALDMAGNVWEWVADWYGGSYYADSRTSNPPGPVSGQERVLRGGSWSDLVYLVRSTGRYRAVPSHTYYNLGFRCARDE